jgi:hypothetical protein
MRRWSAVPILELSKCSASRATSLIVTLVVRFNQFEWILIL